MSEQRLVFRYTQHAEYQLFNRNVTKQAVERTIAQPDSVQADKLDANISIAIRETSAGTFLKVWYRAVDGEPVVQTVLIITLRRERPNAPKNSKKRGKR